MMKAWLANLLLKWAPKYRRRLLILAAVLSALALVRTTRVRQGFVNWLLSGVVVEHVHVKDVHVGEHSISLDPGGVDVLRWSASTAPLQPGDIGMNVSTGAIREFISGIAAQSLVPSRTEYGDGSDGSVTFDGSTTVLGIVPSGNAYTLTRSIFPQSATVNTGVRIIPAGYAVIVQTYLTLSGTAAIDGSGANAGTAPNSGTGAASGAYVGGTGGGPGGAASSAGTAGGNFAAGCNNFASSAANAGGASGAGQSGGAGGTGVNCAKTTGIDLLRTYAAYGAVFGNNAWNQIVGGTGGGGGGASTTSTGGGGGGGGGYVYVAAQTLVGSGSILAKGGNGGAATGSNAGGGAGGNGGGIVLVVGDKSGWTGALTATGGSGGAGIGTGATGTGGGTGNTLTILD